MFRVFNYKIIDPQADDNLSLNSNYAIQLRRLPYKSKLTKAEHNSIASLINSAKSPYKDYECETRLQEKPKKAKLDNRKAVATLQGKMDV